MTVWDVYESPIGPLTLHAGERGLTQIWFGRRPGETRNRAALAGVVAQLEQYFAREREEFDLQLDLSGTPFQVAVWERLRQIPYGTTVSYGEVGRSVGHGDARAIGAAVGQTPVPIVVPCHRVIGADLSLTGYGAGLDKKQALLALEATTLF